MSIVRENDDSVTADRLYIHHEGTTHNILMPGIRFGTVILN